MNNKVKILVAYHKRDKLFRNNVLFPIHLGREIAFDKTKDGNLSEKDYNWLLNNMAGDNTGNKLVPNKYTKNTTQEITAVKIKYKKCLLKYSVLNIHIKGSIKNINLFLLICEILHHVVYYIAQ